MLAKILHHEWRALVADRTLWAVGGLIAVMIGYAAFNGSAHVRFQEQTLQTIHADEDEHIERLRGDLDDYSTGRKEAKGFLDPRGAASLGGVTATPYLTMPPAPLAAFSIGQSDLYPYYIKTGMRSRQMNASTEEIENPINLLSGRFDLAFVIVFLYPLVILALSYNLVSAEKEQGTLALTLSQPVSLRRVVAGKILLRVLVLSGFIAALSIAALAISGTDFAAPGVFSSWLLWMSTVLIYGLFWFVVAVAVNAFGKSSSTNALAVAGIWLAFVLLIPAVVNAVASSFYPVPSRVEMIQAMRVATKEATGRSALLLSRYMEDHPDLMPASAKDSKAPDFASTTYSIQLEVDRLIQPVIDRFDRQSALQQGVVDRFRFLSPAILVQGALNDISGSSAERQKHFIAQVDSFLRSWQEYFYPRVFSQAKLTTKDLDRAPHFQYRSEPSSAVMNRLLVATGGVLLSVLLIAVPSFQLLRRYPVA